LETNARGRILLTVGWFPLLLPLQAFRITRNTTLTTMAPDFKLGTLRNTWMI
jgi:hypothetical protein